jgi:DNA-3-methyladenine glycosylase II
LNHVIFSLQAVPPFRLDLTVWALRRRPDNAVDRWNGRTYRRVLVLDGEPVDVAVTQIGPPSEPHLQIMAMGARLGPDVEQEVTATLEHLLGIQIDLTAFYEFATSDVWLGPLAQQFRGLKPPRFPTLFETLVNAIACQQVTLTLGIRLLNRLAECYGIFMQGQDALAYAFPRPGDLATLDPEALRELGFSRQKARAVIELARALAEGRLDLKELSTLDDETAVAYLRQLRGVGRWTAEYVLLRGVGRLHIFPGDDVGARNNLQRWLGLTGSLDYEDVRRTLVQWQPYAGLIYIHLLLDRLAILGYINKVL